MEQDGRAQSESPAPSNCADRRKSINHRRAFELSEGDLPVGSSFLDPTTGST